MGLDRMSAGKLAPPSLPPESVTRPRVMRALDAGRPGALTLVVAPAGYGKTTAVRAWCELRQTPFVWVSLDDSDNDPFRLWSCVSTAAERLRPRLGVGASRWLEMAGGAIEASIDELWRRTAELGGELVFVLDDYHEVTDSESLTSIDHALKRLPANARIVVVSRADAGLRLARLRVRGALAELREAELAFTLAETRRLVEKAALEDLTALDVESLWLRTQGWPAGLALAVGWLRSMEGDRHAALRRFGGGHRLIAQYLSEEVLAALGPDQRQFLERVAVLGRVHPALCDDVLNRGDSNEMLSGLARVNAFITPLDSGGWYRVHPLLAEFTRAQLAADDSHGEQRIHRSAARWFRDRRLPIAALEHAAQADDNALVADILAEQHLALIRAGRARTILRWAERLPDDEIIGRPDIATAAATAAAIIGGHTIQLRRYPQLADWAQARRPAAVSPYTTATAAMVRAASLDGGVNAAVIEGRQAVAIAEREADATLVAALGGLARALFFAGEMADAWDAALRALEHPDADRRPPGHAFARSTLALVAAERGQLAWSRAHAEKARSIMGTVGNSRSWLGANAAVATGIVFREEGDHAAAERHFAQAERFFRDDVPTVHHAWLLLLLALTRSRRGRLDDAARTLDEARIVIAGLPDVGILAPLGEAVQDELERRRGRVADGEVLALPTDAEMAVLRFLITDLSAREIAGELFLSPNTVRSHIRSIYRKLGAQSRTEAVARATSMNLLAHSQSPR